MTLTYEEKEKKLSELRKERANLKNVLFSWKYAFVQDSLVPQQIREAQERFKAVSAEILSIKDQSVQQ